MQTKPFAMITKRTAEESMLLSIMRCEGEDAQITGMTRSLSRRLLALNLSGSLRPVPRKVSSVSLPAETIQRIA